MKRTTVLEKLRSARPVIAPSLLKCDFGNLHREVALLEAAGSCLLHLDVMDGHFVPNLSYGPPVIESLRKLTDQIFDAHLMISDPARYLDDYVSAGCDLITFHVEAVDDPRPIVRRIRCSDCVVGRALNRRTPLYQVTPYLDDCDLVLVMSVEPGFGGQQFDPAALQKLYALRQTAGADTLLSVDGGINLDTIGETAAAGAELFVVGSSIFDTSDYEIAITNLADGASGQMASQSSEQ